MTTTLIHTAERTREPATERGIIPRPELFRRLSRSRRVTSVSAPAGSGKTLLLNSWVREAGGAESIAFVSVSTDLRDARQFWIAVVDALRETSRGSTVRPLMLTTELDGWQVVEVLLEDIEGPLCLVIDRLHELRSPEAIQQLEMFVTCAPPDVRFVLASRGDNHLELHHLRLTGDLLELRADDLRFTLDEANELVNASGVRLSPNALARLYERTEGWAAGLRLATLFLVSYPDPDEIVEEFAGSERTVAEYLMAEVLAHQDDDVRDFLLRTSILEHVSGELGDLMTGRSGGSRILLELEAAHAFVNCADPQRQWFRYHGLFAEFLQFELRREAPDEMSNLHEKAAAWFANRGLVIEAIRHAQAAGDWDLAARVLFDNWFSPELQDRTRSALDLVSAFPSNFSKDHPELLVALAECEASRGSLDAAERQLALAIAKIEDAPDELREQLEAAVEIVRMDLARRRRDAGTEISESATQFRWPDPTDAVQPEVDQLFDDIDQTLPTQAGDTAQPLYEPLTDAETRVLRYLPTGLSVPEIASELYVSVHTVKTHMRHLYLKLDAHRRTQAIERARSLGLLGAPSLCR